MVLNKWLLLYHKKRDSMLGSNSVPMRDYLALFSILLISTWRNRKTTSVKISIDFYFWLSNLGKISTVVFLHFNQYFLKCYHYHSLPFWGVFSLTMTSVDQVVKSFGIPEKNLICFPGMGRDTVIWETSTQLSAIRCWWGD